MQQEKSTKETFKRNAQTHANLERKKVNSKDE